MPSASATEAMVLAVNMPAQEPSVGTRVALDGQQLRVVDRAGGERPDRLEDRDEVERLRPPSWPGRIVPP